jgi:hypothetical protein
MDASPVVSSKAVLGDIGSFEDEIEDFTDEERFMRGEGTTDPTFLNFCAYLSF